MKRTLISLIVAGLLLIAGTAVYAQGNTNMSFSLENMIPHMRTMHPNWSEEDLREMYELHHGTDGQRGNGMMQQNNNMMNF